MHIAASALLFLYALLAGLWPLVWLFAITRQSLARRWPAVGRLALLLPLWTLAVSVGALQAGPLLAASAGTVDQGSTRPLVAATAMAVALCVVVVAWMLLLRSFGSAAAQAPTITEPPQP